MDSRAEAKRASEERMAHLRLVDEKRDRDREGIGCVVVDDDDDDKFTNQSFAIHVGNQSFAHDSAMAPNKQSAFQIAVSVAHAAENKVGS